MRKALSCKDYKLFSHKSNIRAVFSKQIVIVYIPLFDTLRAKCKIFTKMKNKDESFQALRGLAIAAVVTIHACGINNKIAWNYELSLIIRQLINFAVPIFIFISGYFAYKGELKKRSDYLDFYKKRLSRILLPYIAWCVLIILFYKPNYQWHWSKIFYHVITGQIVTPYYFVIVLIQLIVLTPFMVMSTKSTVKNFLWLSLSPLSLVGLYFSHLYFHYEIKLPWYALPFTVWVSFYYFGILASQGKLVVPNKNIKNITLLYICSIFLAVAEGFYLCKAHNLHGFAGSQIKVSSFLSSFLLILLFLGTRKKIGNWPKALIILGEFSFGIYLFHVPVLDLFSRITSKIGLQNFWITQLLINSWGVIALCCVVIIAARKVLGIQVSQKYLGM
ncbi:acyltransferase [Nostoc sp. UHCC 0302]|uniref:acyltransferase n=1 Tax=Nostoc sp. UHCC 0302 TaxID=3134896 RepID=UPI00311CDBD4